MENLTAKDIMNPDILTVREDWSVERTAEFFVENSISGAPVVRDDGELVGVVSLTDIVLHSTLPLSESSDDSPHDYYVQALGRSYSHQEISSFQIAGEPLRTVGDIMTPVIYKVAESSTVQQVAAEMIRHNIHRVFVTRDDQVVGIIATPDMLKIIRDS
jgi:predicted transcriptional regulator